MKNRLGFAAGVESLMCLLLQKSHKVNFFFFFLINRYAKVSSIKMLSIGLIICFGSMVYHVGDNANNKGDNYTIIVG